MTEMDQHLPRMVPEGPELEDMYPRSQQCKAGPQVTSCLGDTLKDTHGKDSCGSSPTQDLGRESSQSTVDVARDPPAEMPSKESNESRDDQSLSGSEQPSLTAVTSMLSSSDMDDSCASTVMGSTDTASEGMEAPTAHSSDFPLQGMDSTLLPLQETSVAAALGSPAYSEAGPPCLKVQQALEQHGDSLHEQLHRHLEFLGMTSSLQAQPTTLHQEEPPSTEQQGWLQRLRDGLRRSRKWFGSLGKCCWRRRRRNRGEQEPVTQKKACGSEGSGDSLWHTRACHSWRLQQLHQVLQDMDSQVQERRAWVRREMDAVTREAPVI